MKPCYNPSMPLSPSFDEEIAKLNPKQREVVETIDGPLLVVAGPGTGKTQVLALRVANILRRGDVAPSNILCLTFTENGAVNMRERLSRYIGQDAYRVGIFTFHGFANTVITRFPEFFFRAATYTQATDIDRMMILEEIFRSLPHDHPLQSFHPKSGFVYLNSVSQRIEHLKRGGYTPEEYSERVEHYAKEYPAVNSILADWPKERASVKRIETLEPILRGLRDLESETGVYLAGELARAISIAVEEGKMEAVTKWKSKFTVKEDDELILKDWRDLAKIRAVAELYGAYVRTMHDRGLYDYDDMILEVARALEENNALRSELEEQYQFVLIDEFQDTNEAQMRIVRALTTHPVHEGRPNIMVVGDDDQAIYKFQGAEVSNIVRFRHGLYRDVSTVVLDTNYRSRQDILDYARKVVVQGEDRLEKHYDDIGKVLRQGNASIEEGGLIVSSYASDVEEYARVAGKVRALVDEGMQPEEIAILSRGHKELKALLPYLDRANIPYEYSKKANVFDEAHVRELVTIAEYLASLFGAGERKDDLLPEILSFPYWNIPRATLFEIALSAKDGHRSWAATIAEHNGREVRRVHELLAELAGEHAHPLEHVFEHYMNVSGFKEYYFGEQVLKERPVSYVHFLAALKTFIESLREWRAEETITVADVGPFVTAHRTHGIALLSESPFVKADHAVQVMTAHAAKGLEFGAVFIISAHDDLWTRRGRANNARVPAPLLPRIAPAGDTEDDFIRLLYVALTRAKHSLYISGHRDLVRYLEPSASSFAAEAAEEELDLAAHESALALVALPYHEDEWAILRRLVASYRMSPTHLGNFCNVAEGGPVYFVKQNLLQFPQPKHVSAVFGSAIHAAIEEMIRYPKWNAGERPSLSRVLQIFRSELAKGRLLPSDRIKQERRGVDLLTKYYTLKGESFLPEDEVEVNMHGEGVVIDGAVLTGKLDLLRVLDGAYVVRDWKTGNAITSWDIKGKDPHEKIKLHHYKQQLIFYKILLEHSTHYRLPVASLELEFVEQILERDDVTPLAFCPSDEEISRLKLLIVAVYRKITTPDFPDTSAYPPTLEGIIAFEDDLIAGVI